MHCRYLLAFTALPLSFHAAYAAEPDFAIYQLDTDVKLVSDQRTRGVSDSLLKPAVKVGLQFAHESGIVAAAEVNNVSKKQFTNSKGINVTLGAGYRAGASEGWHYGFGVAAELFPGAKFEAPHAFDLTTFEPLDVRSTSYNSSFAVLEVGYGALEARLLDVVSRTYRGADTGGVCGSLLAFAPDPGAGLACYGRGDHGSRGTLLFDLDYKVSLTPATTLALHAGRQRVANFNEASFNDYRIGLSHKHWGLTWSADWVATRNKVRELYLVQDGDRIRATDNDKLVLSVSYRF